MIASYNHVCFLFRFGDVAVELEVSAPPTAISLTTPTISVKEAMDVLLVTGLAASLSFRIQDVTGKTLLDVKTEVDGAVQMTPTAAKPPVISMIACHHQHPLSRRINPETPLIECCWVPKEQVCVCVCVSIIIIDTHARAQLMALRSVPTTPHPLCHVLTRHADPSFIDPIVQTTHRTA